MLGLIIVMGIAVAIVVAAIGVKISQIREQRFHKEFFSAFKCQAPCGGPYEEYYRSQCAEQVLGKVKAASRELAEVRSNLQNYRDTRRVDSLGDAMFRGMLINESAKAAKRLESNYKHLYRLARKAGYPRQLLDDTQPSPPKTASSPTTASAS